MCPIFRTYQPTLGRYLTPDPIGIAGGLDLYGYAGQNPVNYVDPFGLKKSIRICLDTDELTVLGDSGEVIFQTEVVHGCEDTPTDVGTFKLGDWIQDLTSKKWGTKSATKWSESWWGHNVFGPYYVPIHGKSANGETPNIGIHGTMGPRWFGLSVAKLFSPCSHGCVRVSNATIMELHDKILPDLPPV